MARAAVSKSVVGIAAVKISIFGRKQRRKRGRGSGGSVLFRFYSGFIRLYYYEQRQGSFSLFALNRVSTVFVKSENEIERLVR